MLRMIEMVEANCVVGPVEESQDCLSELEYFALLEFLMLSRRVVVKPTENHHVFGLKREMGYFPSLPSSLWGNFCRRVQQGSSGLGKGFNHLFEMVGGYFG